MRDYLRSKLVRIGLILLVVGSAPLWGIILAARLGLWPDPDPNPIGPGLLFVVTFWPAVMLIGVGVARVRYQRRHPPPGPGST
jgi:hypothetical protein